MAPFDIGVPQIGGAGGILNTMNAWFATLTSMGELEWVGLITIGLGVAVVCMALVGASSEMSKDRISGQYG